MSKPLLPLLLFLVTLITPSDIFASSLEVSKSSNFSESDTNFASGETVYVRVATDKAGSSSVLSVRDNNYSSIKTINLNRNGDSYTASFSAPSGDGYYSLEAKIKGEGMNVTSVKTIKVGNPTSANINVNVNSSVKGTSSGSENSEVSEKSEELDSQSVGSLENEVEVFSAEEDSNIEAGQGKGFFANVFGFFEGAWNLFKFF